MHCSINHVHVLSIAKLHNALVSFFLEHNVYFAIFVTLWKQLTVYNSEY
uniref:Uncharacterized protein n=1 Tax=Arundo donax TaxID=35708 RepID=A0A0A9HM43_ARUDO